MGLYEEGFGHNEVLRKLQETKEGVPSSKLPGDVTNLYAHLLVELIADADAPLSSLLSYEEYIEEKRARGDKDYPGVEVPKESIDALNSMIEDINALIRERETERAAGRDTFPLEERIGVSLKEMDAFVKGTTLYH